MSASRPQRWSDADADLRGYVLESVALFERRLGRSLIGVYLHGSLAMGCFHRPTSDLDLLVVVREGLAPDDRRALAHDLLELSAHRPAPGDLELSVLRLADTRHVTHPSPYELHYSASWRDRIGGGKVDWASHATDVDLAAHLAVVRARGVCLQGARISDVFGPVSQADYLDSVKQDIDAILAGDHLFDAPCYGVLNCCRFLQLLRGGEVSSKAESTVWALANLSAAFHPLIAQAYRVYCAEDADPTTMTWDHSFLSQFHQYVRQHLTAPAKSRLSQASPLDLSDDS